VSELTGKFLHQLQEDIATITADSGSAGMRLRELSQRVDIDEENSEVPVSLDKDKGRILIHSGHPAVKHLLDNPNRRRTDLLFFASSMMSLLNREDQEVTDEHERAFHARLLAFALQHGQGSWTGNL
jgi:hypothetical protein